MVRSLRFAVFAGVLRLALASLPAQSFTLEQVMSAPFSSHLEAAPVGSKFVWSSNQQGRRNLWVGDAAAPDLAPHAITAYTADDGQDLGDIVWTPDGQSIVYVRGGDFEYPARPLPNPALLSGGVDQTIWIVPASGGSPPRKVAEGRAPAVSPDGKTIAFLSKEQIWTVAVEDQTAKPTVLFHGRGSLGAPFWSPDGKSIAFTSARGDHGFIGVYSLPLQTITYLQPSTQTDRYPVWSPDSKQLAFVRIPPEYPEIPFRARREAEPWSLWLAEVATGKGHEVWRAAKGAGSVFRALATEEQLLWSAGNRLIFAWERDGWEHLYAVDAGSSVGAAILLTPGEFEVEHVALSHDRASVVYSSNQGDIDRRHVWRVAADGKAMPHQLTRGNGIEVEPTVLFGGTVVVLHSDARVPIRPAVVSATGDMRDVAPELVPKDFPATKLVIPQQVIFEAADGMRIHGQLFLPPSLADGKKHPALVFFHGGSRRQMLLGWHYMDYYSNAYAMNQSLASLGYIVLSANYRSGIGYGLNFREALHYGADGASEYNDVQGAGLYLRGRADVDPARIGAWGGSYGGFLTALALARSSDLFAAGVDFHGVHDWLLTSRNFAASYDPSEDPTAARRAWESSPLSSVKTWKSPVLLIQGDDDRNVQFANTVKLAAALRTQGVEFEERIFPDEIHAFLLHRSWIEAYTLSADFLNRHLNPHPLH